MKIIGWFGLSFGVLVFMNSCARNDSEHRENATHAKEVHWGYEGEAGPDSWGELSPEFVTCAEGKAQSPIDLVAVASQNQPEIMFNYQPTALNLINNGHTIQVNYDAGSFLKVDGILHKLLQFHFHTPSEHTINGKHFALEMHLVHQNSDSDLAVLGVMIESGSDNEPFTPIWENLPTVAGKELQIKNITVNAADLLPEQRQYYRYNGSLTTPPCTEGVQWFVLRSPVQISDAQIESFQAIFKNNNRPVQPLNDRKVLMDISGH